ncbi:rod shape-determining protein MreD [Caproiciproducens sp. CPB-2]|uniref:rod shape-determining protein MreD n=1 Tax=Caproiciproducens sp. CPB-2 TaxID=3030017 RepID=UPI0023DC825B|nr:rod shape-determining protein MreD [Caproiciproducens sp. CPB-2]MDF1494696.1 rod shape-determining protein MreD [Caproiciproducens sp. CPB-2]
MEKLKVLRYFAYTIEILVFYMVQETPGLVPDLFGARPVLLIPIALSIAMFEKETAAMAFGLLCGLLIDFGAGGVLGFHGLLLSVICYSVGLIAANLIQTNFLTAMITAVISTGCVVLLQWVFFYLLFSYSHAAYALTAHYIPRFFYTTAFMPVAYYFNRALALQIRAKEE